MSKVRMQDIAQQAGVSQATVSIVLNGSDSISISESTKQKVLSVAQKLGYSKIINTNDTGTKKLLVLIHGSLFKEDHFIGCINAMSRRADELNCELYFRFSLFDQKALIEEINSLESSNFDALIITTPMTTENIELPQINIKTIYLNCLPKNNKSINALLPNDYQCAYNLGQRLATKYKKPFILAGDNWMVAIKNRLKGYKDAFLEQGVEILDQDIVYTSWLYKQSFEETLKVLSKPNRPDLLICCSDYIALAVYHAIYQQGLKIPEDIAVVGFDNQDLCTELSPHLSSVTLPYALMGKRAVDYALNDEEQNQHIIERYEGEVIIRESSPL